MIEITNNIDDSLKGVSGIYLIVSPSGRNYVGQSINILQRMLSYQYLKGKGKVSPLISKSILKYGFNLHKVFILEFCSVDSLETKERFYIDLYKSNYVINPLNKGLNLTCGGGTRSKDFISQTLYGNVVEPKKYKEVFLTPIQVELLSTLDYGVENRSYKRFMVRAMFLVSYINLIYSITGKPVSLNSIMMMSILGLRGETYTKLRVILQDCGLITMTRKAVHKKNSSRYVTTKDKNFGIITVDDTYLETITYRLEDRYNTNYGHLLTTASYRKDLQINLAI